MCICTQTITMKKIIAIFLAALTVSALCACGAAKLSPSSMKLSDYSDSTVNDKVQLYIQQRTVTDETESVTLILQNLTDSDYTYDVAQRLELWKDGKWYSVSDKQDAVALILYTLPGGGEESATFYFTSHYDKLIEGRYRIVVPLVAADGSSTLAAAEFGIGRAEK